MLKNRIKKSIYNIFLSLIFISLFSSSIINQASAQTAFNDVPYDHDYSMSIYYLKSNEIIEGYPDNTFKPDSTINRVEFLKIVMESADIEMDINIPASFSDVNNTEWFAPYIRKATYEGWIQGYPDSTFKPTQNINKVEALKIIAEIQNWKTLKTSEVPVSSFEDTFRFAWYSPSLHFSIENNLLEEVGPLFYPNEKISRGYMSELIYKTLITPGIISEHSFISTDFDIDMPLVITPSTFEKINPTYFDNLILSEQIPNVFYINELFVLEGEINSGDNSIFAFLVDSNNTYTYFKGKVEGTHFKIPMFFNKEGTFKIGIIPGTSGESKTKNIYILNGIPPEGTGENVSKPYNLSAEFNDNTTTFKWNASLNNVFRIYFKQGETQHYYFVRNVEFIDTIYSHFKQFNEGTVEWMVLGSKTNSFLPIELTNKWSNSQTGSFKATQHHYREISDTEIQYATLPEKTDSISTQIYFAGKTNIDIYSNGAVILPSGLVEKFIINTTATLLEYESYKVIPTNSQINFTYNPDIEGTYIFEINNDEGSAVINFPVYVGSSIPLIPDFYDLHNPANTTNVINLNNERNKLLNLINKERGKYGLSPVLLTDKLNDFSQDYAEDMNTRKFIGHVNPDGLSTEDRRILANIGTQVSENLAYAPTLEFAHESLMRSAVHRQNILNEMWDTVGLGVVLDDEGYLYVVEEFSHHTWSASDLDVFEDLLLQEINNNRSTNLNSDIRLENVSNNWSNLMVEYDFFSFVSPTGENLSNMLYDSGVTNKANAYILKDGTLGNLTQKVLIETDIKNDSWKNIGVGITQNKYSKLFITIIFTE